MPRSKSSGSQPAQSSTAFKKTVWCKYELTHEEVEGLKHEIIQNPSFAIKAADTLVAEGYKVVFDYDWENKSSVCYVFPVGDKGKNVGMALSGRARLPSMACAEAYYKHWMMSGTWVKPEKEAMGKNWDDDLGMA